MELKIKNFKIRKLKNLVIKVDKFFYLKVLNSTNINEDIKDSSIIKRLAILIADLIFIFTPVIGYFFQGYKFYLTKSSEGFSKNFCLISLITNILKIFFYFGRKYAESILFQAIIIIVCHLILLSLCIKYQEKNFHEEQNLNIYEKIIDFFTKWGDVFKLAQIWKWKKLILYYKFLLIIILFLLMTCLLFGFDNIIYMNFLGALSSCFESFLLLPQIFEVIKTKNGYNVSSFMVFLFFIGDAFKVTFIIFKNGPIQMILGGIIQILQDIILYLLLVIYGDAISKLKKILEFI